MASFRLGPLKQSPQRKSIVKEQQPFSIDPSLLQVSLEQTQPTSAPLPNRQTSGKSSPSRGRCVKEYEEQLQQLQHENFNLKLRVFLLEERMGKALGRGDAADIIKDNIELKVENETLKKSLTEKNGLLAQASSAIEELESQQRASQVVHQSEKQSLEEQLQSLQKELTELREMQVTAAQRMNSLNLMTGSTDESVDLYAQAFGSFVLNSQQLNSHCNHLDHHTKEEMDDLQAKIAELESSVEGLRSEAAVQIMEMEKMKLEIDQSQPQLLHYQQRIKELECDLSEQVARIRQLEAEETDKDTKIDCLLQQLETRNHRNQGQEARGQSIHSDPQMAINNNNKASETSSGRVQEIVERDKIIEEKEYQLEQQNKILVEIQITLDEKQKQIDELESALAERKKKVDELENSLSKAGRTLQGFVADVQKKDKELETLKAEAKKKDKRIKDLTAELKEVKDMLNKAKWEAETSGREDNVKAMAEEENERLWAELEEKKRLLEAAERERHQLRLEADRLQATITSLTTKDEVISDADRRYAALSASNDELNRQIQLKDKLLEQLQKQLAALHNSSATPAASQSLPVHQASQEQSDSLSKRKNRTKSAQSTMVNRSATSDLGQSCHVQVASPMVAAESRIPENQVYFADLQQQISTLRNVVRSKDQELTQLRQEVSSTRKEVLDLSSKLLAEAAVCRMQESSIEHSNIQSAEEMALRAQLAVCMRERQELSEAVDLLRKQLASMSTDERSQLIETLRKQLEASEMRAFRSESEMDKLRADLKMYKKKSAQSESSHGIQEQSHLRMYKKEVTVLRKRLADSTNACDILRTRLEEMADFLEEILSLSEQGMLNLSNWSAKRRQTLQHSILQSRELSRSLSQSLMIGVDMDSLQESLHDIHSTASSSVSASSWSVRDGETGRNRSRSTGSEQLNSSRENLSHHADQTANNVEEADVIRLSEQLVNRSRDLDEQKQIVDKLRSAVTQLEEQVKQRDMENAWLKMELQKEATNANKSVHTETKTLAVATTNAPVSSTPYHRLGQAYPAVGADCSVTSTFISPIVTNEAVAAANQSQLCRADRALVTTAGGLFKLGQSMDDTVKTPVENASPQSGKKTRSSLPAAVASESEAWSEPDRNVSMARMGLSAHEPFNSTSSLTSSAKKTRGASSHRRSDSGDSSSNDRRSRSDAHEVKKVNNRLRLLEQENSSLRSQLSTVISSLRCTWNAHKPEKGSVGDESPMRDESTFHEEASSILSSPLNRTTFDETLDANSNNIATAQHIIDALQGRLIRMKESMKRKEQRLRDSKDMITQLEFKVKEKYFKNCENESRLKEAYERLQEKKQLVVQLEQRVHHLETRSMESDLQFKTLLADKELLITELKRDGEVKLRSHESKFQTLEKALSDTQTTLRQKETELLEQIGTLQADLETMKTERQRLQYVVENFKSKLELAEDVQRQHVELLQERDRLLSRLQLLQSRNDLCNQCQQSTNPESSVSRSGRKNSDGLQRQLSHMSDYVSDQAVEEPDHKVGSQAEGLEARRNSNNRPSILHLSPDLGIDSDRFSSLERGSTAALTAQQVNRTTPQGLVSDAAWRFIGQENLQRASDVMQLDENGELQEAVSSSPDVLSGQLSSCSNCQLLRRKYTKAKQTLAATLEKLQAANVRKEKVDRALNRELGKTHNVLCQARGILEQANQSAKNKP